MAEGLVRSESRIVASYWDEATESQVLEVLADYQPCLETGAWVEALRAQE